MLLISVFYCILKTAESLLNSVLQERAPKDILVPRRSSRHTDVENPSAKKRKCKETRPLDQSTTTSHGDSWQENEPRLHILNDRESSDVDNPTNKRRIVRNAGGWISPTFSSKLDRSWISKNEPSPNFDISDYVPQIGDIVL